MLKRQIILILVFLVAIFLKSKVINNGKAEVMQDGSNVTTPMGSK